LVAQGNFQNQSTYFETFADTASAKSINILFSVASASDLETASIDIKTAFLYSPLQETIYLRRPSGLSSSIMPPIVKLNKCIYGLKQAAHEWRKLLDLSIKDLGFHQFQTDACIYKLSKNILDKDHTLYLGVFVDDILCLGTSSTIITWGAYQNSF